MSDAIVLLHGSANGSYSWGQVRRALASHGAKVLAPDMLGYGGAPAPSETWTLLEEVEHLRRSIDPLHDGNIHLVAHSLGTLFALHLRLALGERVTRMTLLDPVLVSVLRETGEADGYAEMEAEYQRFMGLVDDPTALSALAASPPPTTLVVGERTRVAPTAVARQLAQAFRAVATVVVPGAGHMLPLTHAAAVAEAVRRVLDRPTEGSAP